MPEVLRGVVQTQSGGEATIDGTVTLTGGATFDNTLTGPQPVGDISIPAGQVWLFGAGVEVTGNVLVDGTLGMRPGSGLKFLGADPDSYVGGGLDFDPTLANDIGLWVRTTGILDIQGTPKVAWNRTGTDPTWLPTDELWITPTDLGDFTPRRWFPGDPVPRVSVPAASQAAYRGILPDDWIDNGVPAEVANVTRDVVIEGPGHIHIRSAQSQIIKHVTLRRLGVSNVASNGPVPGRAVLHFHKVDEGSRGTVVEGIAAIDSQGKVFIPHQSNGITIRDSATVTSLSSALWWNPGDFTHDLLVDGLLVVGARRPKQKVGKHSFVHPSGTGMVARNCVVAGGKDRGFHWSNSLCNSPHGCTWTFEDNIAHNNEGSGINFWLNGAHDHHQRRGVVYRNDRAGIENGAYANAHRYTNILLLDNAIVHHSHSEEHELDNGPARYTNVHVHSIDGPCVLLGKMLAGSNTLRTEWIDCKFVPGPSPWTSLNGVTFAQTPVVLVHWEAASRPFVGLFRHCGITPDDVQFARFPSGAEGSNILIEHEDGRRWEVKQEGGQRVVVQL